MVAVAPRWFRVWIPLLLFAFNPASMDGQVVRGRLIDDQSGDPVPSANIRLLRGTQGSNVMASFMTDEDGTFLLESKTPGRVRLRADRIGYREVTSPPFDLVGTDTLDVELRMAVEAVPLAPLTVVSKRAPLLLGERYEMGGFLERKERYGSEGLSYGVFLEKEDWAHRSPGAISDILREVAGLRIMGREIRMRITGFEPRGCLPEFYLDGHHIRLRREVVMGVVFQDRIEDFIPVSGIGAIEVYNGISKPAQFMDMGDGPCGAIAIWTG